MALGKKLAVVVLATQGAFFAITANAQLFGGDEEARRRIETLRQQVQQQDRALEERLGKIEAGLSTNPSRDAILELASQLDSVRGEIAKLRGQIEVLANQAEVAERRQKDLYLDIDTRLRKLEQAREQAALQPPPNAQQPNPAEAEPSAAETRAYQAALDQFKLGNYSLAVAAMQGFLVTYPSSKLAPNAQYWIGMAHSGQRNYKEAIAAQRKLLAAWPDSDKAPDAMLSIASAQETMGDRKSAQRTLEELIARFPSSSSAAAAKQRLAASSKR
jgi:tol-pal system protein YbgF